MNTNNLYTFKADGFMARAFTWLWRKDPVSDYPGMCPYFWTWVLIIIFFPLVLAWRLFTILVEYLDDLHASYKQRKKDKNQLTGEQILKEVRLTKVPHLAYQLYESPCYEDVLYSLTNEEFREIQVLALEHKAVLRDLRLKEEKRLLEKKRLEKERIKKIQDKVNNAKDHPIYKFISIALLVTASAALVFALYLLSIIAGDYMSTWNWDAIWEDVIWGIKLSSVILLFIAIMYLFISFVIDPICNYFKCRKKCSSTKKSKLAKFGYYIGDKLASVGNFIVNMFKILFDMIYNTYKQQCPRITWVKSETK